MNGSRDLNGRRVVVTRAVEQADALADLLAAHGAVPVVVPLVRIVDDAPGMEALAAVDLAVFDWIIVTSPNGAERLAGRLGAHAAEPARVGAADRALLAALGAATATALTVAADLVPAQQSADGLLDEFPAAGTGGGDVLVVQAVDAEPTLVEGLRERGWRVVAVAPHRTVTAPPAAGVQLAALAADAVLFASGSAARAWAEVFGPSTPPIVIAIGPRTAAAAERAGLKVTDVAADHSLAGMVDTLVRSIRGEG